MKTLVTTLLTVIVLGCPIVARGEEIPIREESNSISLSSDWKSLKSSQIDRQNQDSIPKQRKVRKTNSSQKKGISGYAGATLGGVFPDLDEDSGIFTGNDTDINDGFGGSLFGGVKFNRYIATDLELSVFSGDIDSDLDVDDESYTISSIMLNPRFILPLNDKENSLDLFLSPGLGISNLRSRVEDEVGDFDRTTVIEDDTRFTWQVKGGASVPVSRKFSVLGQLRYASQTGDDAIDYFTTELGVEFDF